MTNQDKNEEKPINDLLYELSPIYSEYGVRDTMRDILTVYGVKGDELDEAVDLCITELNRRNERNFY